MRFNKSDLIIVVVLFFSFNIIFDVPPDPNLDAIFAPVFQPGEPLKKTIHISRHTKQPKLNESSFSLGSLGTKQKIQTTIRKIGADLDRAVFGLPGDMSYNIVFLLKQSLLDFDQFVQDPQRGPLLEMEFQKDFLGKYDVPSKTITLGKKVLNQGEAVFLTTIFHEYQHYLYHSFYTEQKDQDIVWKFYNEAQAYLFSFLFGAYLPSQSFGRMDDFYYCRQFRRDLIDDDPHVALGRILDHMIKVATSDGAYAFLMPTGKGLVTNDDLVDSIGPDFYPESGAALSNTMK